MALFAINMSFQERPVQKADTPMRDILIAARSIDPQSELAREDYIALAMPADQTTDEMLGDNPQNRAALIGLSIQRYIPKGTAFVARDLEQPEQTAATALTGAEHAATDTIRLLLDDDASTVINTPWLRDGMRAIAVPVSAQTAVAGLIQPNDRVDIIALYRLPNGANAARVVIENVRVLAKDQQVKAPEDGEGMVPNTVTLELHAQGVKLLILAMQAGQITLALNKGDEDDMPRIVDDTPMLASEITALLLKDGALAPQQVQVFRGSKSRTEVLQPRPAQAAPIDASALASELINQLDAENKPIYAPENTKQ